MKGVRVDAQLFRTEQYENATRDIAVLEDAGVPYQLLESAAWRSRPRWRSGTQTDGQRNCPMMKPGDCQLFTQNLARMARNGVIRFNTPLTSTALRWWKLRRDVVMSD